MKKSVFLAGVIIFAIVFPEVFANGSKSGSDNHTVIESQGNKLSEADNPTVIESRDNKLADEDNNAAIEIEEDKLSEEEINLLEMRIEEIRDMDKSNLAGEEKKELKNELRDIREQMRKSGGIYISFGALIIILLLLIILT